MKVVGRKMSCFLPALCAGLSTVQIYLALRARGSTQGSDRRADAKHSHATLHHANESDTRLAWASAILSPRAATPALEDRHDRNSRRLRIGVVTFILYNHGTYLQNACLLEALRDYGDAELIPWRPRCADFFLGSTTDAKFSDWKDTLCSTRGSFRGSTPYEQLGLHPQVESALADSYLQQFDMIVIGSDTVWDGCCLGPTSEPCEHNCFFDARVMYGSAMLESSRLRGPVVSFAATVGSHSDAAAWSARARTWLRSFSAISVRDRYTERAVRRSGHNATHVLDPTMLLCSHVAPSPSGAKKAGGVVLYLTPHIGPEKQSPSVLWVARRVADRLGEPMGPVMYIRDDDRRAEEFVAALRDASLVLTNTFHGLMVAVAVRSEVAVLGLSRRRGAKVDDALHSLGLRHRRVDGDLRSPAARNRAVATVVDMARQGIDWSDVTDRIAPFRATAHHFLEEVAKMARGWPAYRPELSYRQANAST